MAADYYRQASELGHSGAQVALGYAYDFALGVPHDRMQAEQWYARAMASGSVTGMNNLAYSWADQGIRLDEARNLIMQVLAVAPDEATFLDTLGWILFKQGKYEASLIPLCRASVLESGHPELTRHFGDALWMVGEFARARAQWEHALDLTADPAMLSESGRDFLGVQDIAAWTADLRARLAHGLTDDTIPATVEIPHACADLTS
jgi:TPR repeat protein